MDSDSIRRLQPKNLARLLGLTFDATTAPCQDDDDVIGETLQECLDGTWHDRPLGEAKHTARIIKQLLSGLEPGSQRRCLGDVLTDPQAELAVLRDIRRRAKKQAREAAQDTEHTVAVTVYFAAIANALLYHETRITTASCDVLEQSFARLAEKRWMPGPIARLFQDAVRVCRKHE